jgi:hypothetical protein
MRRLVPCTRIFCCGGADAEPVIHSRSSGDVDPSTFVATSTAVTIDAARAPVHFVARWFDIRIHLGQVRDS